ncbi:MAG: hypothetical protein AB9860_04560 [Methanomassiliicoccales archaeon]
MEINNNTLNGGIGTASNDQIRIDEKRVANELLKNPSQDLAALSNKLGFSKQKVWRIVHDLEQNGAIFAHAAVLNPKIMGKRSFIIMFERSFKGADKNLMEQMTVHPIIEEMEKEGIHAVVEDSYYLNGVYDWVIFITVDEHKDLLRFMGLWRMHYGEYFSRVVQSEVMFVTNRNSIFNPKLDDITEILR